MPMLTPELLASLVKNSVGMYTPPDELYLISLQVYKITIYDPGGEGMYEETVVAVSLIDAALIALETFNNGYRMASGPLSLDAVVAAKMITDLADDLLFSERAMERIREFYPEPKERS